MSDQLIQKEYRRKVKLINHYNKKYYNDNTSEITDAEYDLLKPEAIERFFKDIYGGTEEQATGANMKLVAPYALDKINKFFNLENSSLSPSPDVATKTVSSLSDEDIKNKAKDLLAKYSKQNN